MKLPAPLVSVVIAASGCGASKQPVADARVADAAAEAGGGCETYCIPGGIDGGVACMTGCADAGAGGIAVCPAGCEPIG